MSKRGTFLRGCGGFNSRTGDTVGSRHRWPSGWGVGTCQWCHRNVDDLRVKDTPAPAARKGPRHG